MLVVETGYQLLMVVVGLLLIDIAKDKNLNLVLRTYFKEIIFVKL